MVRENNEPAGEDVGRRTFLRYVVAATSSFIGIVAAVPLTGYLASPLQAKEEARWVNLGKTKDFAPGTPQVVAFSLTRQDGWVEVSETRTCWVVPQGGDNFSVINGRCTHLGCAFSWRPDMAGGRFFCPCHDGVYDKHGKVVSGPPPRALDKMETKVEDGELFVLYQDFRLGVEAKEPL